ncbi:hypothetical protein AX774_g126 [Zancudomyces culisetae]|uniref:Uncharacterized protein n=1 Tax=Zancudomyces culisetae TaxID=1213189 RepID=A0A1R1PZ59_ZANCU|nr:hypothetical protein AX774_g126 [Zancudomyces culisetae]|eukprot:OMH86235.1 hypothetical protein AX774_g126 [Zancudomyces culisetae]
MNINAAIWGDSGVPTTYIETLPNLSVADLYITTTKFVSENIRAFVFNLEHDKLSVGMKLGSIVEWAKDITLPLSIDPDESQTSILESEDTKIIRFRMKILKLVNASQKQNVSSSTEGANKSAALARNGANATRRKLNPKITELTNLLIEEYGKINAKDLKRLKNISCTKCRNLILTTNSHGGQLEESTEWKVINLPTEYWSEMIDYWVCHPDGESYNVNMERASITGSFDKNDLGIGSKNKVFTGITELVEADQGVEGGKGGRSMTEGHKTIKLGDIYLGLDEANIESTSVVYDTKRIANKVCTSIFNFEY